MKATIVLGTLLGCFSAVSDVRAVSIAPGEASPTGPAFRSPNASFPDGTMVDRLRSPFSGESAFGGLLVAEVYTGRSDNPFGGLTFLYRVRNNPSNPAPIGRASFAGFGSYETDIMYSAEARAGIISPAHISRDPNGDVVGFNFFEQPNPPTEPVAHFLESGASTVLFIHTAADKYAPTGTASFIGRGAASVSTFAPVPEPSSLALLLLILLTAVARTRFCRSLGSFGWVIRFISRQAG